MNGSLTVALRLVCTVCLFALVAATPALAVNCTPEDITLSSQAEVDSFQANHGPCDRVVGDLVISGADITNLDGLSDLTAVDWLQIIGNQLLTDVTGLSSVTEFRQIDLFNNFFLTNVDGLGGDTTPGGIVLWNNYSLTDLDAFSGVTELDGSLNLRGSAVQDLDAFSNLTRVRYIVNIIDNPQLQSIAGLANIADFDGTWYIENNPQLASLEGIGGQTSLTGLVVWDNDALTHLDQFAGLETVGNLYSELLIRDNDNLVNVDGLAELVGVNAGLTIRDNPKLDDCAALRTLLDDVDDADPGPGPGAAGIPDLNGELVLENNLPGCNTVGEILPPARYHYGGIVRKADQLLFTGVTVTRNCFTNPVQLPDLRRLPSSRLLGACGLVPYRDEDILVYDVARDECRVLDEFLVATPLQVDAVYQGPGNLGAPLRERAEALFQGDRFALLHFDAVHGGLVAGEPAACPGSVIVDPGDPVIFIDGFE